MPEFRAVAVIPARYASTRFPGKPLANDTGKFLIQHVYEQVRVAPLISDVIIATDDRRIADAVESFGGRAVMTRADHPSGTDRIAEVAENLECDVVEPGAPLLEKALDKAVFARRLEQLPLRAAPGNVQNHAVVSDARVVETVSQLHAEQLGQHRQTVIQGPGRHTDMIHALDS